MSSGEKEALNDGEVSSSHFDDSGHVHMVDVSLKSPTVRTAVAGCRVNMGRHAADTIRAGTASKGDVLAVARLAGIMAAKQTATLIPLCHAIPIESVSVDFRWDDPDSGTSLGLICEVEVRTSAKTGVEMEAMTAASVAGLTIYDMIKSIQRDVSIDSVRLIRKTGGKSGDYFAESGT